MAIEYAVTQQGREDNVPWFLIVCAGAVVAGFFGIIWYRKQPKERQQDIDDHTKKLIEIVSKKYFNDLTPAEVQHYLGVIRNKG